MKMFQYPNSRMRQGIRKVRIITVSIVFLLHAWMFSAVCIRADGEIILYPGEIYPVPCLTDAGNGQEYDISIDNPDIVGLDETGKCIVAVAAGTTEVTVRFLERDAAYLYVFSVVEQDRYFYDTYNTADENVYAADGAYDGGTEGPVSNDSERYEGGSQGSGSDGDRSDPPVNDADKSSSNNPEQNITSDLPASEISTAPVSDLQNKRDENEEAVTGEKDEAPEEHSGIEEDAGSEESGIRKESDLTAGAGLTYRERMNMLAPVTFIHGRGKYDVIVPRNYKLWICARSMYPVSVLYVGADGTPIPYRLDGNMVYIDSNDLPSGKSTIQMITADASGRIAEMNGFEVSISF